MASTNLISPSAFTDREWAEKTIDEAFCRTYINQFRRSDKNSVVYDKNGLIHDLGDKIPFALRGHLNGPGFLGGETVEGNEELIKRYNDSIIVDWLVCDTKFFTNPSIPQQRDYDDLREEGSDCLSDWWAPHFDEAFFNQICGNTAVKDLRYTGQNPVLAPSDNRIIRAKNHATDEAVGADSTATFNLQMIYTARSRARNFSIEEGTGHSIRPIMINGRSMYVMFLHDCQVNDLRKTADANQFRLFKMKLAAMQQGEGAGNPILTNALGVCDDVILHEANRITEGVHSEDHTSVANTRRAVLCGAQAACTGFGQYEKEGVKDRSTWAEAFFNHGRQIGIRSSAMWGLKKTFFQPDKTSPKNAEDYGTLVMTTYAAAADNEF